MLLYATVIMYFKSNHLIEITNKLIYMKLIKLSDLIEKYMIILLIIVTLVALFLPKTFTWLPLDLINYFIIIMMFCMSLTLKTSDFSFILKHPKDLLIGFLSQFLIMPTLAFLIGIMFNLETGLFVGLIMLGTCPGGTSSPVISYLSKGDLALSIGMTNFNTILASIITPLITFLILKTKIQMNIISMFLSIIEIVILPIILGLIVTNFFEDKLENIKRYSSPTSIIAIILMIGIIVSDNSSNIFSSGIIILASVILLNLGGYLFGFLFAKANRMPIKKCKSISIETGMRNSALASSLAHDTFPSLVIATVPGAIFSVWHNISGFILAKIFIQISEKYE